MTKPIKHRPGTLNEVEDYVGERDEAAVAWRTCRKVAERRRGASTVGLGYLRMYLRGLNYTEIADLHGIRCETVRAAITEIVGRVRWKMHQAEMHAESRRLFDFYRCVPYKAQRYDETQETRRDPRH